MVKEMFLSLYKPMVQPHIDNASQVWSPQYKKDKITLENVQRRATRLDKCTKHLPYSERLKALGLPTLEYHSLERADMIQEYKILHDIDKANRDMRGSRKFCQRGSNFDVFFFFFFFFFDKGRIQVSGPSSACQRNAIKWRFAGVPMMA